jgi:hypothetical protein
MNKSTRLIGTGIAAIAGSVLTIAPVSLTALAGAPARVCLEDESIGDCSSPAGSESSSGGTGSRVAVQDLPTVRVDASEHVPYVYIPGLVPSVWTGDAKDHPNYGQVTPEVWTGDAKDHPSYGQVTPAVYPDAKDHPNYGQVTSADDEGSGNVGLGGGRASGRSYAV